MTTQAMKVTLITQGASMALEFDKTNTDDAWAEAVDTIDSKSLYKKMKGRVITHFLGYYTAGTGMFRIRNPNSGVIKARECLHMVKGQKMTELKKPVRVEDDDVIEVFSTVAGG